MLPQLQTNEEGKEKVLGKLVLRGLQHVGHKNTQPYLSAQWFFCLKKKRKLKCHLFPLRISNAHGLLVGITCSKILHPSEACREGLSSWELMEKYASRGSAFSVPTQSIRGLGPPGVYWQGSHKRLPVPLPSSPPPLPLPLCPHFHSVLHFP